MGSRPKFGENFACTVFPDAHSIETELGTKYLVFAFEFREDAFTVHATDFCKVWSVDATSQDVVRQAEVYYCRLFTHMLLYIILTGLGSKYFNRLACARPAGKLCSAFGTIARLGTQKRQSSRWRQRKGLFYTTSFPRFYHQHRDSHFGIDNTLKCRYKHTSNSAGVAYSTAPTGLGCFGSFHSKYLALPINSSTTLCRGIL